MAQAKKNEKYFPNRHTPQQYRATIPTEFNRIITSQSNIILKKAVTLFLSDSKEIQYFDNEVFIPGNVLSNSDELKIRQDAKTLRDSFGSFEREVNSSKLSVSTINVNAIKDPKQLLRTNNVVSLNRDEVRKLLGPSHEGVTAYVLVDNVRIHNGGLYVSFGQLVKKIKERINGDFYNNHHFIVANTRDIVKFRSNYSLDFYYLIAMVQPYENYLEVDVAELCKQLSYPYDSSDFDFDVFNRNVLDRVVKDPVLDASTCSLKNMKVKKGGRFQDKKFQIVKRDSKRRAKTLRFEFKSNKELSQELLNRPYLFIKHLQFLKFNESTLIQIIARVNDGLIKEEWINLVINKTYDYAKKKNISFEDYNKLIMSHIKADNFINDLDIYHDFTVLTNTPGVSISETMKANETIQMPDLEVKAKGKGQKVFYYVESLHGLDQRYISYIKEHFNEDFLEKKLKKKEGGLSNTDFIKQMVLRDFKDTYQEQITSFLEKLEFTPKQGQFILKNMDDTSFTEMLFKHFENGKLNISASWRTSFRELAETTLNQLTAQ